MHHIPSGSHAPRGNRLSATPPRIAEDGGRGRSHAERGNEGYRFLASLIMLLALPAALHAAEAPSRPNILYIMADDHAAHAIGAYGSRINKTPNLDRLARDGMRLDACFCVNSICTPSRACILTGKYSHKNGVPVFNRFDGSQPTLGQVPARGRLLHWHDRQVAPRQRPDRLRPLDDPARPGRLSQSRLPREPAGRRQIHGYVTDIITDLSIDFLKNRPKDKPFFLMCHHKAPHRPWDPDDKHFTLYDEEDIPEPATLRDDYATRTDAAREATMRVGRDLDRRDLKAAPPPGLKGDDLLKWKYQRFIKDYLRCVASIDDNVGRLLDFLDREGLSQNTVVIYTSDQGFFLGDHGWFDKRFMYEQSIKMPFLIRWPGVIQPGSTQAAMVLNVDFAPTLMEIAGLKPPGPTCKGRSFAAACRSARAAASAAAPRTRPPMHELVLPLLPRPRRPQHAGPLRRPHRNAQADLLLEEEPMGVLRLGSRSRRIAQPRQRSRPRRLGGQAQGGAISAEKRGARQRRIRRSPADDQFLRSVVRGHSP